MLFVTTQYERVILNGGFNDHVKNSNEAKLNLILQHVNESAYNFGTTLKSYDTIVVVSTITVSDHDALLMLFRLSLVNL